MAKLLLIGGAAVVIAAGAASIAPPRRSHEPATGCEQATARFEAALERHKAIFAQQMEQLDNLNAEREALTGNPFTPENAAKLRSIHARYLRVVKNLDPTPALPNLECAS